MGISTYSYGKGLRDSTLKIFVISSFQEIILAEVIRHTCQGLGSKDAGGTACSGMNPESDKPGWDTLGHCKWPQSGQEHNHRAVDKIQQEGGWKSRETPIHAEPWPPALPLTSLERQRVWMWPQQNQCLWRVGKRGMILLYDAGHHVVLPVTTGKRLFVSLQCTLLRHSCDIHVIFYLILFHYANPYLNPYKSKFSLGVFLQKVFLSSNDLHKILSVHFDLLLLKWQWTIKPAFLLLKLLYKKYIQLQWLINLRIFYLKMLFI